MQPQINALINARQRHLSAAGGITEDQRSRLPLMAKFHDDHIREAKKLQQQIQNMLCEERIKKSESERMKQVIVKHTTTIANNAPRNVLTTKGV